MKNFFKSLLIHEFTKRIFIAFVVTIFSILMIDLSNFVVQDLYNEPKKIENFKEFRQSKFGEILIFFLLAFLLPKITILVPIYISISNLYSGIIFSIKKFKNQ